MKLGSGPAPGRLGYLRQGLLFVKEVPPASGSELPGPGRGRPGLSRSRILRAGERRPAGAAGRRRLRHPPGDVDGERIRDLETACAIVSGTCHSREGHDEPRARDRLVDHRHQGDPGRPGRRSGRRGVERVRLRDTPAAVDRAGPRGCGGTPPSPPSARSSPSSGVAGDEVEAVGLTGQMHGSVLLDEAGDVVRPAILWNDQRTAAECDEIRRLVGADRLIEVTGNDALTGFTAPKLLWVARHEPENWARVATILLPKDYVQVPSHRTSAPSTSPTGRAPSSSTWRHGPGLRRSSIGCRIDPSLCPPTFEGPEVTGLGRRLGRRRHRAAGGNAGGGRWRRPVGQRRRRRRRRPRGSSRSRWGPPVSCSPPPRARQSSRRAGSTPSATPSPAGGT